MKYDPKLLNRYSSGNARAHSPTAYEMETAPINTYETST